MIITILVSSTETSFEMFAILQTQDTMNNKQQQNKYKLMKKTHVKLH